MTRGFGSRVAQGNDQRRVVSADRALQRFEPVNDQVIAAVRIWIGRTGRAPFIGATNEGGSHARVLRRVIDNAKEYYGASDPERQAIDRIVRDNAIAA